MNQPLMAVQICIDSSQDGDNGKGSGELVTLFATPNHPFWVETPLAENEEKERMHWLAAECLEPCMVLQLADGRSAEVRSAALIRRTQHEDIFFAGDERVDLAQVLCLKDGKLEAVRSERLTQLGKLDLGERYLTPVYNFEVEQFHTYYVGEAGVWVHNTECAVGQALDDISRNLRLKNGTCFDGDTAVHVDEVNVYGSKLKLIQFIEVGDRVLSRCEKTGEMAYKRVTKVFSHGGTYQYSIKCKYGPEIDPEKAKQSIVYVTAEHPFWVQGKGWVAVENLQIGDPLLTHNGISAEVSFIDRDAGINDVFNFEVEDFHTYFVHWSGLWVHNTKAPVDVSSRSPQAVTRVRSCLMPISTPSPRITPALPSLFPADQATDTADRQAQCQRHLGHAQTRLPVQRAGALGDGHLASCLAAASARCAP